MEAETATDTQAQMTATLSAKVIRADGTEEDLGIISVSDQQADQVLNVLKPIVDEQNEQVDPAEVARRRNEEESKRNQEANEREIARAKAEREGK